MTSREVSCIDRPALLSIELVTGCSPECALPLPGRKIPPGSRIRRFLHTRAAELSGAGQANFPSVPVELTERK
jgi:hypothetical protein